MDAHSTSKIRVNGSLLNQFKGQHVCLVGQVATPDASGMSFKLKTSDDAQVIVQLREILQEPIEGIIEVRGIAKSDKLISCQSYVQFPSEYTESFDMKLYNDAVNLIHQNRDLYLHYSESM